MLKKIVNKFWLPDNESPLQIAEGTAVGFLLNYDNMVVGTLSYSDNQWKFEYSDEFKSQNKISPLVNFLQKGKVYQSSDLWPFFAARVPGNAQLTTTKDEGSSDLVTLLKEYGHRTITNPFELRTI